MADTIRVVVFGGADGFVAQCLEYDICAQGSDVDSVTENLRLTLNAEAAEGMRTHGRPFGDLGPAPARFEEDWAAAGASMDTADAGSPGATWDAHVDIKIAA